MKAMNHMNQWRKIKGTVLACVCFSLLTVAAATAGEWNVNSDGVVLDGFDVVSYHTADQAVKGNKKFSNKYDGGVFYFSSKDNLSLFKANPQDYAPAFNGFCAFAVGMKNAKVPANPDTFKMYNGKLLMFFNDMYEGQKVNTKIMWNGSEKELFAKSNKNWKGLSATK